MLPRGICVHATTNRLRIRFPDRKGDKGFFSALEKLLTACDFVKEVRANAATGSLLVLHEADADRIADYASEKNLFAMSVPPSETPERLSSRSLVQQYRNVDRQVRRLSNNALSFPDALVLTLVGSGLYQLARGNWTAPNWHTCFWYGMTIFLNSRKPGQAA